jgi:hypothetical protein
MSTSARHLPPETDRITRAIFEQPAALCAHADAWVAGAEQHDDMTVVGLRVCG